MAVLRRPDTADRAALLWACWHSESWRAMRRRAHEADPANFPPESQADRLMADGLAAKLDAAELAAIHNAIHGEHYGCAIEVAERILGCKEPESTCGWWIYYLDTGDAP